MNLLEALNWRYATKRMNGTPVPQEKLDRILEAIRLAPSSAGLQPYEVIVVTDPELKKKLQPSANNQPQIVESGALLVFAAWSNLTEKHVDDYMDLIVSERGVPRESLDQFSGMLKSMTSRPAEDNFNWAARSAYIGLGFGLIAAADEQVDATPMEGFNPAQFDEILGLSEKGLRSVAIMTLGYRDAANDYMVNAKKVRKPYDRMFHFHS